MFGHRPPRRSALIAIVASVALVGSVLSVAALASTATSAFKYYIPTVAAVTPPLSSGTTSAPMTFTLTNSRLSTASLGSANISVPSGFTLTGTITAATFNSNNTPAGKIWVPTLSGSTIQLRTPGATSTNSLNAGQYVVVSFSANVPCQTSASGTAFSWPAIVKQSNNFNGPNNDFVLAPGASAASVTVTGFCVGPAANVVFSAQPTDTLLGNVINGSGGVQVTVTDSHGNPVPNASVVLSIGTDPTPGATLTGTSCVNSVCTVTASLGVATFSGLKMSPTSTGYQLQATSGGITTKSATFAITNIQSSSCLPTDPPCTTTFTQGGSTTTLSMVTQGTPDEVIVQPLGTFDQACSAIPLRAGAPAITTVAPQGSNSQETTYVADSTDVKAPSPGYDPATQLPQYQICALDNAGVGHSLPFCSAPPATPDLGCINEQELTFTEGHNLLHTVYTIPADARRAGP